MAIQDGKRAPFRTHKLSSRSHHIQREQKKNKKHTCTHRTDVARERKKERKRERVGLLWIINRLWAFLFFSRGLCRVVDECPAGHVYTQRRRRLLWLHGGAVGVSVSCLPRDRVASKPKTCVIARLISAGGMMAAENPPRTVRSSSFFLSQSVCDCTYVINKFRSQAASWWLSQLSGACCARSLGFRLKRLGSRPLSKSGRPTLPYRATTCYVMKRNGRPTHPLWHVWRSSRTIEEMSLDLSKSGRRNPIRWDKTAITFAP